MKISVIVCTMSLDRFDQLMGTIASLENQSLRPDELVIPVDHNQELFNILVKKDFPLNTSITLNNDIKGTSATRNAGILKATGDIIAFIDDDAVAEPDWLEKLTAPFQNPAVIAIGGNSIPDWTGGKAPSWFPDEFDFIIGCTQHKRLLVQANGEIRNVSGSNMAFRREVFDQVGLWNTRLGRGQNKTGGEEAELCLKIKSCFQHSLIVYAPEAIVFHKVSAQRMSPGYVFNYAYNEGKVRAQLEKLMSKVQSKPLEAENLYLRRMVSEVVPGKIAKIYRDGEFKKLTTIILTLLIVSIGYLVGRFQNNN